MYHFCFLFFEKPLYSFCPFFSLVGCLAIVTHERSLCTEDANCIPYLLQCNIAGSEFLRRWLSSCWPRLQSSQGSTGAGESLPRWFMDCGQPFLAMCTSSWGCSWRGILLPPVTDPREWKLRRKLSSFYNLISDVTCHYCCSMRLVMQTFLGTMWENTGCEHQVAGNFGAHLGGCLAYHTHLFSALCVANVIGQFFQFIIMV